MRRGRDDDHDTPGGHDPGRDQRQPQRPGEYGEYGQPAYGQNPYGQNQQGPYGRTRQEQGSWSPPYGAPVGAPPPVVYPPPPTAGRGNGRPGLIVAFSLLVQVIVIAAVGNTWVVRHGLDYRSDHNDTLGAFGVVPSVVSWRFTPLGSDAGHVYIATLVGLAALLVVAALLTLALVRGPITFWRAFFAVLLSVLAGTLVNGMVRRAIFDGYEVPGGKVVYVLFQSAGAETVAGVLVGLLPALVAALVAVVSRRSPVVPVAAAPPAPEPQREPDAPPPWYGNDARDATPVGGTSPSMRKVQSSVGDGPTPGSTTRLPDVDTGAEPPRPTGGADAQATTQFKAVTPERTEQPTQASIDATPAADDETTTIRRPEGLPTPSAQPVQQPDQQSTQAFPRPPDDEDEGHHPDH